MSPDSDTDRRPGLVAARWLRRGLEIARVLWRYGLGIYVRRIGFGRFLPKPEAEPGEPAIGDAELPERLRKACEDIGPVAVKLGQALSTRPDLIPREYAYEFRKLQVSVAPFPYEEAKQIVESELEAPISELFQNFERRPRASASMAQVHYARLQDHSPVAVKVQRPKIPETVETDLQVLQFATRQAERHIPALAEHRASDWMDEFARSLREELDFDLEADNTEQMGRILEADPRVTVPAVHRAYSTRRVLTLQWIDGVRVDELDQFENPDIEPDTIALRLAESILRQVFIDGFFHADPHAGNIVIQDDGDIVLLDCGNASHVGEEIREAMVRMLMSTLQNDSMGVCDQIIELGAVAPDTDLAALRSDVRNVMGRYEQVEGQKLRLGQVLEDIMGTIFRHKIVMPAQFAMVLRALILVEGTCRQIHPEFDLRDPARIIAREIIYGWLRPSRVLRGVWQTLRDMHHFSQRVPRQISELLADLQAGTATLTVQAKEQRSVLRRMDAMTNRIAFALVVAAIIVGSALLLSSEAATAILTTPGVTAYVIIGALMGIYLLYSIIRSGRL